MTNFLTADERAFLIDPERHETSYVAWRNKHSSKIVVDIDARPLVSLVEAALYGSRVYELMSIHRPGDILHYLWVSFVELDDALMKSLKESVDYKHRYEFDIKEAWAGLPFIYFDEKFFLQGDDTEPSDFAWRKHIDNESWYQKLSSLYQLVCNLQQRLRGLDDFLLQNEVRLIDDKKHRRDFFSTVKRSCTLDCTDFSVDAKSAEFFKVVAQLIAQEDVRSVSCPFGGLNIWRILVTEQVTRSQRLNLPLQEALHLYGPDSGLKRLPEDWGGEVRIPYESMFDGDVVFLPGWRVFHNEYAGADGSLAKTLNMKDCRYLFVPKSRGLGELGCATREEIGEWVLYSQKPKASISSITVLDELTEKIAQAAKLIAEADAILITAGAGMGVDSGLPDFRGDEGFWNAYPALAKSKIKFYEIASPGNFEHDPKLAWGFYGHRLNLYRNTKPHAGFRMLREIAANKEHGCFVFTSNVDGHFRKAGFDPKRICECHGSIHHLQCINRCLHHIWDAGEFTPEVDEESCQLLDEAPKCSCCGDIARPNILMFNDFKWEDGRYKLQRQALSEWLAQAKNVVIIELGAGKDIPTVRHYGEMLGWPLIRINPRDFELGSSSGVSLPMGALDGLNAIYSAVKSL
ncbi:MAG: Sir2 family NAD-dependent protein deacetylase [Methylotenera sp.]